MTLEEQIASIARKVFREEFEREQQDTPAILRGELTLTELAGKAGVNRNALARLEKGKLQRVSARIVTRVAKALQLDVKTYWQAVQRVRKAVSK